MLTRNFDISDGLINGSCGVLKKVAYDSSKKQKITLWIEFDLPDIGTKARKFNNNTIKLFQLPYTWTPLCINPSWNIIKVIDLTDKNYFRNNV